MAGLDYTTRDKVLWIALLALCLVSAAAYVLWALPAMPETVPTHWGADGSVNGWSDKGSTIFMGVIMPILMLALLFAVPFFDPRGTSFIRFKGIYQGFSAAFTVFMIVMAWLTPATALGLIPESGSFVSTLVFGFFGLLLVGLGAAMPHIEPNYTFGVRIPWTLNDSDNWRRTHRFAGPVFVVMGAVMLVAAFFSASIPQAALVAVLLVALLGGLALVTLYSFLLWKGVIR